MTRLSTRDTDGIDISRGNVDDPPNKVRQEIVGTVTHNEDTRRRVWWAEIA